MTRNWEVIKWIFEPDGSLLDLYVQDVTLVEWEKLIDLLNVNFNLTYGEYSSNQIDKEYVLRYLSDETGKLGNKTLTINFNGITINCYFFLPQQIEFDINPKDIKTLKDFESIEKFMLSISMALKHQVTLTAESSPQFPLFKVDFDENINKVLTQTEAKELSSKQNPISIPFSVFTTKLKMRFFPETFKDELRRSANEIYKSTGKNKNLW